MAAKFSLKACKANRNTSLPDHWDILMDGDDDSVATVWKSQEMAQSVIDHLNDLDQAGSPQTAGGPQ